MREDKVTPETMPPDGENLLVMIIVGEEKKVMANVRRHDGMWQALAIPINSTWVYIEGEYITHRMLCPKSEEDETKKWVLEVDGMDLVPFL